jgi:LacI family transcriptional regulator
MSIAMETDSYDHIIKIKNNQIPLVFFDRKCEKVKASNILIDDYQRSFEATEQLIKQGCKRIFHFTGNQNVSIYRQRLKGYENALRKNGLNVNSDFIFESALKKEDGAILGNKILQMSERPDGILSANDFAAISAMKVLEEAGLRIPEDIAIIGFSNEPLSEYTNPPLTTVDQSPYEMGIIAAETILNEVNHKQEVFKDIIIPSSIINRKSSLKNS